MNQQTIVPRHNGEALASLGRLEDRIQSTIELLRTARHREASAEEEIARLKERVAERDRELQRLSADLAEYQLDDLAIREVLAHVGKDRAQIDGLCVTHLRAPVWCAGSPAC